MTAQPIGRFEEDPHDPAVILARLPEREHGRFLAEYQAAAEAATHEVWRFKELTALLHRWSLITVAVNAPGYYEAREDTRLGIGDYVTLEEVIAERRP
jgi:hypothetical protein